MDFVLSSVRLGSSGTEEKVAVSFSGDILVAFGASVEKRSTDSVLVVIVVRSSPRSSRFPGEETSITELSSSVRFPAKASASAEPRTVTTFAPCWTNPARGPSTAALLAGYYKAK